MVMNGSVMENTNMKLMRYILLFGLMLGMCFCLWGGAAVAGPPSDYPAPPDTDNRLFYLQRSMNSNTVVYDANITSKGQLDSDKPVKVYWLRYNNDGKKRGLNFAERNFAYGLNSDSIENGEAYLINLMAYSGRDIKVMINANGLPEARVEINGKMSILKRIYLEISGSGFWTSVKSVELLGVDLKSGEQVIELFDPDDE